MFYLQDNNCSTKVYRKVKRKHIDIDFKRNKDGIPKGYVCCIIEYMIQIELIGKFSSPMQTERHILAPAGL